MAKAKLVQGADYTVFGKVFKRDVETNVDKETADYLKNLDNFEVTEEKKKTSSRKKTEDK